MRKFKHILNDVLIGLTMAIAAITISHLLASCSNTIDGEYTGSPSISQDGMALRLNIHTTDYQSGTRAQAQGEEGIPANSMQILCFDSSGKFIAMAKDVQNTASGGANQTVTGTVPTTATTLHFLANANITSANSDSWTGKSESEVLAALESNYTANKKFVYWGSIKKSTVEEMKTYLNGSTQETVQMLRDRAKVTVTNNVSDLKSATLTVCNALQYGRMTGLTDQVNLPTSATQRIDGTEAELSETAYAFEHPNQSGDYLKVILKATYTDGTIRYHQIILENDSHEAYKILRNHEYKITLSKLSKDAGYAGFYDAVNGTPSNNAFVSIDDIIPEVSDGTHSLLIDNGTYIVLNTGASSSQSIAFTYTGGSDMTASDFKATWVENNGLATSATPSVGYDANTGKGTISYTLSDISTALKTAKIQLLDTKNGLSRTIHLYSITQFDFNASFESSGNVANQLGKAVGSTGTLTLTVPDDYPIELLPVEFKIASNDINPVNLGVEVSSTADVDGGKNWNCWFVYKAQSLGNHTITIKNVRTATANTKGKFYVKAAYFGKAQEIEFTYQ